MFNVNAHVLQLNELFELIVYHEFNAKVNVVWQLFIWLDVGPVTVRDEPGNELWTWVELGFVGLVAGDHELEPGQIGAHEGAHGHLDLVVGRHLLVEGLVR